MSQVSSEVRERVRADAKNRCGYCLSQQKYVLGILEIDHIVPKAVGGADNEENLWLACRLCNAYKGTQTAAKDPITRLTVNLFNPRLQTWQQHFRWINDGVLIEGKTDVGRATVVALQLNNPYAVMVRQAWISAGWHPPETSST
ncbi:HNH endonuclease [Nodosilinea sp. PGN35]|uniref:HNH endonuclease n=1 Tax=Nodosilinea sp. PGN35 TaxID=3020489 RepID=UPI0023B2192E|nr:HNH endonuclease signature motif containing protein [Nodosilinea sp. TSF1-S3]